MEILLFEEESIGTKIKVGITFQLQMKHFDAQHLGYGSASIFMSQIKRVSQSL